MPPARTKSWSPLSSEEWLSLLRSVALAMDLLSWSEDELRQSGLCVDLAAVERLSDCFDAALNELDRAGDALAAAERRLLTAAMAETPPG